MKPFYFTLLFIGLFGSKAAFSQDATRPVSIRLVSPKKEPIPYFTIKVLNRLDSSSLQSVADSNGLAILNLKVQGHYELLITSVNFPDLQKNIVVSNTATSFSFIAENPGKTMEAAVITAQRPLIRQEDDKTIIDPENLAAASTSGFEIIEKTPGLFVDQDGNIYISSLTPAAIQINGREMKMSAADVATMLKSLPPTAISRIEIVRSPSAKYDATSSGGIVNIILKKGVRIGMTGSVNGGIQQGTYGNQFIGFNLNNNDGKKTSSINFNYSRRNTYEKIETDRNFAPDSLLSQKAFTRYPSDVYFAGYSLAFPAGRKWDMDLSASASLNDFRNNTSNGSVISKISTNAVLTDNLNISQNDGTTFNLRSSISGTLKLDSAGSEWVNDLFYNYSRNQNDQQFTTDYSIPAIFKTGGDGTGDNRRNHFNMQSDLKLKLPNKITLETGLKASFLEFTSVTDYYRGLGSDRKNDPRRTNTFNYRENINAAYLQGSRTVGKDFVAKAGLRLENTNMTGHQIIPGDTTFKINRTDLFPYIYLSKNLMKIAGFDLRAYLIYRRTINRPVYEQLNPFPRYIDEYLSEAGNPSLRPQFTQNYEANISVDERPIFAVGVNDTRDIFTNVIYQADSSQSQAYRTYDNLGKNKEWYFRGLGAIPPGKRFFFVFGAQYNHNFYQGLYENKPLAFKKGTWTFFTYQTFRLDKKSVISINGFMRLKGQQQFYELSTFGSLNSSINRKFLKDKLIVTLSLSDIFSTNKNEFVITQGSINATGFRQSDTRRLGLNLRYNFGIKKKEDPSNLFNADPPIN